MCINDAVINRLDDLLAEKKMTYRQLAEKGNFAFDTLVSIRKKLCSSITLNTLRKICRGFGISMKKFMDCEYFTEEWLKLEPDPKNPTKPLKTGTK